MMNMNIPNGAKAGCLCAMMAALLPIASPVMAQAHPADTNGDNVISLAELENYFKLAPRPDMATALLRAVQLHNAGGYAKGTDSLGVSHADGFAPKTHAYIVISLDSNNPAETFEAEPAGGWTDAYKTTKLVLRHIDAGTFTMGSPGDEPLRAATGETQRDVTIGEDFYIGVFPVTQRQWELVMGSAKNKRPSHFLNPDCWETRPLENASLADMNTFLTTLRGRVSNSLKMQFALPSEAQWEYACRAGTTASLNNNKNATTPTAACPNLDALNARYAFNPANNYVAAQNSDAASGTAAVGSSVKNAWGLYDMHGNVQERCQNLVLRGGAWNLSAKEARSAARATESATGGANKNIGLRVYAPAP